MGATCETQTAPKEGILLVDKPVGITSFGLVAKLRKLLGVKKIGHAGTLDPFATGVMVMLIGRNYTKLSDTFLCQDKEYRAVLKLGESTTTFDHEGEVVKTSDYQPSQEEIFTIIEQFQGDIEQIPPMFSAKKIGGKKLYELARKGIEVERRAAKVHVNITFLSYSYPHLTLHISCSKGTYIRSLADDIGTLLKCGAHLVQLRRTRSGRFPIADCLDLDNSSLDTILKSLQRS